MKNINFIFIYFCDVRKNYFYRNEKILKTPLSCYARDYCISAVARYFAEIDA